MLLGGRDGRGTKDRIKKIVDPNILIPCNLVNLTIFEGVPFSELGGGAVRRGNWNFRDASF